VVFKFKLALEGAGGQGTLLTDKAAAERWSRMIRAGGYIPEANEDAGRGFTRGPTIKAVIADAVIRWWIR